MTRSARDEVSAWASVLATMNSTPDRPETIILLTALPPAPPTPHTMMRGFNSFSWGGFRLIGIPCLSRRRPPTPFPTPVETLSQGIAFSQRRPMSLVQFPHAWRLAEPKPRSTRHDRRAPGLRGRLLALMVNIRFIGGRQFPGRVGGGKRRRTSY